MRGIFERIALLFSSARRQAQQDQHFLDKLDSRRKAQLGSFSKKISPSLDRGLRYADNIAKQSLEVLLRKERMAQNLRTLSEKFWDKNPAEPLEQDEQAALKHITDDIQRIETLIKEKRTTDLRPMIAKANHVAKMINIEEREAVNPMILREFETYERSLLKKTDTVLQLTVQLERDEFDAIGRLIKDLKRESISLQDKPKSRATKKRMQHILAEILMLENVLELAAVEDVKARKVRDRAIKLYEIIQWMQEIEEREKSIMEKDSSELSERK